MPGGTSGAVGQVPQGTNGGDAGVAGEASVAHPSGPEPHWALDPNQVYLWGTLLAGRADVDALANVYEPSRFLVGFKSASSSSGNFLGDQFIYKQINAAGLTRQFVTDVAWRGELRSRWHLSARD